MVQSKYTELFHFEAEGMDQDLFHVLSFRGTEALSSLFSFDIELVSKNMSIDLGELLSGSAKLTIKREGAPDAVFAGRPASARQTGCFGEYAYYSVTLRPAFWKFTQLIQSAVFLDKTAPETVEELLESERFFPLNYEMRLTGSDYPSQEFAMQHEESIYDYITWRMEQQGAYFYFAPDGDTVIFSDSPQSHDGQAGTIYYSPTTGLEGDKREEVATSFSLCQTPLPARVVVRSYSWKNPNTPIVEEASVSQNGFGDVYFAHEPAETEADASRIAEIRAEELICHSKIYSGVSSSPIVRPGAVFKLDRHYNSAFNREYMIIEAAHEGAQEAFISLGLGIPLRGAAEHLFYRNEFKCIESDVPYRPERKAPRAKITGVMRAFVDGAGDGSRAETDEYGRYKLVFPFDISGRSGGNASCWIRMAQLQAGADSGLALPVQPGVEVLVSFEEGDPDRPYISGVLANGETGSIYGSGNRNIQGLRTAGGNQITINDEDKKQGISMIMPSGNGLIMSAGSSDLSISRTDTGLTAASTCATDLAGVMKTSLSGFRSMTCATTDPTHLATWASLCSSVGSMVSDTLTSLSKSYSGSTSNALSWSAGGVKDLMLVLNSILQSTNILMGAQTSYNVALTAKSDSTATSLIQAKAGVGTLVALVTSLIADAAVFTFDVTEAGVMDSVGKDGSGNAQYYDKNFNKTSKAAAQRSYTTSSVASLIPEVTSIIVLLLAKAKQSDKLGGILLNAMKENVTLNAGTSITEHADGSILLHAGAVQETGTALKNAGSLENTKAVNFALAFKDIFGAAHWGVSSGADGVAADVITADQTYLNSTELFGLTAENQNSIGSVANLIYDRATDAITITKRDRAVYSDERYTARGGSKGATLSLKKDQWFGYAPTDATLNLGVITQAAAYPTQSDVLANKVNLSGIIADKKECILQFENSSRVLLDDSSASMLVPDGAKVELTASEANVTAKTVKLASSDSGTSSITLDSGGIKVSNIKVSGSDVSSSGVLTISGGMLKLC